METNSAHGMTAQPRVCTHCSDWRVTLADLVRLGPEGRDAVRAALGELGFELAD
ncbi:hypothetical protein ACP4I1_34585 [Streptomyces sp. WG4]|uniref:hypothetical protein n=1 Tax=Streptomyces sp. WG4 TaxID=3417649 RepID=UPI003CE9A413